MIETKDYISWGFTLASLIFAAWQYYEKKKEQARNRANIQLTVGYPIKFVPNSETQHLLDFHEPKQEYNRTRINGVTSSCNARRWTFARICLATINHNTI